MARLDPVPAVAQRWSTRAWMWMMRRTFGRVLRPYPVLAHAPKVVTNLMLMNMLFEMGDWALPADLRKLVHMRVASLVGCEFCQDIIAAAGRKRGAGSKVDNVANWATHPDFTERERAALGYAEMVTMSPSDVSDAQFAELRRFFSDREIVELTAQASFEGFRARMGRALRIEPDGFKSLPVSQLPAAL
jgi:alkylhydroperoxidase family enzyme